MSKFMRYLFGLLMDQAGWTTEMAKSTATTLASAIPDFWADGILMDATREGFWGSLSGKERSNMPVIDKTGPLKQKGDGLQFNTIAQLMGAGVTGESVLKGNEEVVSIGLFTVSADIVRHAVAVTRKATRQANFDLVQTVKVLLKDWMARKMDHDGFDTILDSAETIYAGSNKSSEAELNEDDGDSFGISEIEMLHLALTRKGAMPLKVVKSNGRSIPIYGCVYGEVEDYRLNQNTAFVQAIRETWQRFTGGQNHPLYQGAVGMYRNMILYPYYSQLPIPQGTPLRPETLVYATLTTTATVLSVGGATASSGSTPDYTAFFASSGSIQVEDEIIDYSGKEVNAFTGLTRGSSSTTAAQHVPNKRVTQRNIATVIGFGAEALFRAIGDSPFPITQTDDYGFENGLGIEAYYGQSLKKDARLGQYPNVVQMKVYSKNPSTI